jgi:uncharacterized protein
MPKNHFKLQAIAFACCLAFASSGRAQDAISPEKRALIDDLLRVNRTEQNMQESMTAALGLMGKTMTEIISKSIPDQLDDKGASKEAREQAAEMTAKRMAGVHEMMMKQINVPELIEQVVVPLYDKYYTESELRDLIAFYKTPTGQKMITVQPQLTGEAMSRTMQYLMPKMEAVTKQISEEMLNELKKDQDGHKSKK